MPDTAQTVTAIATAATTIIPEIAPEVLLIMGIIKAHQAAHAGQFPTPDQVQATYGTVTQSIKDVWASWIPSGR